MCGDPNSQAILGEYYSTVMLTFHADLSTLYSSTLLRTAAYKRKESTIAQKIVNSIFVHDIREQGNTASYLQC
jgi:hypothetical protein